jgi:beta-lactam-binding protein with PASTA domain
MRTFDDEPIRLFRGPGWFSVFVISLVTSFAVAVGVEWAIQRGLFPALRQVQTGGAPQEPAAARAAAATPPERGPAVVKVPMIAGMSVSEANQLLTARGLKLVVREKRQHDQLPPDSVISQDPLPESPVNPQSAVAVAISVGKPNGSAPLPDLTGQPLEHALKALEAGGYKLGPVAGPSSGPRVVKSSDPAAGQTVPPGTSVGLTVVAAAQAPAAAAPTPAPAPAPSAAPQAAPAPAGGVVVPKIVGLPWSKAKKALEESGLMVGKVRERFDEDRSSYVVLEQTPIAGTQVAAGSGVDVVRNEGD